MYNTDRDYGSVVGLTHSFISINVSNDNVSNICHTSMLVISQS